jgi:hypothetical protein
VARRQSGSLRCEVPVCRDPRPLRGRTRQPPRPLEVPFLLRDRRQATQDAGDILPVLEPPTRCQAFLRRRLCLRIHRPTPPRERVRMPTMVAQDRSAPEAVRVWLLGDFSVSVGDRKVDETAWRLRKAASLMKLLTLAPGHRMHREQAMDFLWPDSGKKAASNNLSQILHVARRSYQGSWMRRSAQLPSGFVRRLLLAYSFRPSRPSRRRRSPPTRASTTCRPRELALWVGSRR